MSSPTSVIGSAGEHLTYFDDLTLEKALANLGAILWDLGMRRF